MNQKIMLLIVFICFICVQSSFAAFPVKTARKRVSSARNSFEPILSTPVATYPGSGEGSNNIVGILSLASGIIGLTGMVYSVSAIGTAAAIASTMALFCIPAIVLGTIGITHHKRFSVWGLVLGLSEVLIVGLVLLVLFALVLGL